MIIATHYFIRLGCRFFSGIGKDGRIVTTKKISFATIFILRPNEQNPDLIEIEALLKKKKKDFELLYHSEHAEKEQQGKPIGFEENYNDCIKMLDSEDPIYF